MLVLSTNCDTSGNFLVQAYLKLSYKEKMKSLWKVGNYPVSMLPGQKNLAQNSFFFGFFFPRNCMFSTSSQWVNLASESGLGQWFLFWDRVLLQFPVGTSQSILGDVIWPCWMVWRRLQWHHTGLLTDWVVLVAAPCDVQAVFMFIRHHLVPFKGQRQTSGQCSIKQGVSYFEEKHLWGRKKIPKPNRYWNNCTCATIWTSVTGGPRRIELCVAYLPFQPRSVCVA